uniref:ATP-dependent Clp protease proteolytic subunit n=1 Tax=Nephroselmis astigmatica TaxID=259378 RepID=A0A088CKB1_9CHLO|nr:proteolytic subunit 2 of clp protease [Nephroselmis astigmatica]AID67669.1 proteolytic subunit 2 of clp protease [Nephroselmis astigmatica]
MPIGVPKVAYRLPGESIPQWVDLYNRLYRERLLFMGQDLDDELANQLVGIMLYLNAEDETQGHYLYINSPGGSVLCGLAVFDIIQYVEAEVTTICVGIAASMASFVLSGGEFGQRIALPHSRVMLHQPEGGSRGQANEIVSEAVEVIRIRQRVAQIYTERTGQDLATIILDMDRDIFMAASAAKQYGVVDQVSIPVPWG